MRNDEYIDYEETGKYHYVKVVKDNHQDDSPRDWDNFGIMACVNHRNYALGDKEHTFKDVDDFLRGLAQEIDPKFEDIVEHWESGAGWQYCQHVSPAGDYRAAAKISEERVNKAMCKILNKAVILPLYLYDHSGITMRCAPFDCPWDSGQVGFIYATPEMIREEYGCKIITKAVREKATKLLRGEVETYDQYLTGDVWGVIVEDMYGEEVDSCWGFYGSDYAKEEAKDMLANADTEGRAKYDDPTFNAIREHEADLRREVKRLQRDFPDTSPFVVAQGLEKAAKLQKERMALRDAAVTDHFAKED